jgi:hypothetical protein
MMLTPLAVLVVLAALLKYSGEYLLSSASIFLYLIVILLTIIPGIIIAIAGAKLRVLTTSLVLLFFLYAFYFYPIDDLRLPFSDSVNIILIFCTIILIAWIVREKLSELLVVFFSVLLLSVIFIEPDNNISTYDLGNKDVQAMNMGINLDKKLPNYVHIILDQHIGIDGMLVNTEERKTYVDSLVQRYLSYDFNVYSGAFNLFNQTNHSIPSILNFNLEPKSYLIHGKDYMGNDNRMISNKLFNLLKNQGYKLNVYETDFINMCDNAKVTINKCVRYSAGLLFNQDETLRNKILITLNEIATRYRIVSAWNALHFSRIGNMLNMPFWSLSVPKGDRFGTSSLKILKQLGTDITKSSGGEAFIAHILLPHDPYIFDSKCNIVVPHGGKYKKEYKTYLSQLICTQEKVFELVELIKRNNLLNDTTIVIHSDHGSNLSKKNDMNYDKRDFHSSLFVEHIAGGSEGIQYRQHNPVVILLMKLLKKSFPDSITIPAIDEELYVYNRYEKIILKSFKDGKIIE